MSQMRTKPQDKTNDLHSMQTWIPPILHRIKQVQQNENIMDMQMLCQPKCHPSPTNATKFRRTSTISF